MPYCCPLNSASFPGFSICCFSFIPLPACLPAVTSISSLFPIAIPFISAFAQLFASLLVPWKTSQDTAWPRSFHTLLHIATTILQVMRVQGKYNPLGELALMLKWKHYTTWAIHSEFWSGRWLERKKLRWKQRLLVLHYICMWVEKSWKGLKSVCGISVWSPNHLFGDGYVVFIHWCLKPVWVLACSKLSMIWNIHISVHNENSSIIRVLLPPASSRRTPFGLKDCSMCFAYLICGSFLLTQSVLPPVVSSFSVCSWFTILGQ